ncbi:MotE family protein [Paraliobacillus sp. JSM ZJ581]|uniref:MotE family protein n=1 Tax=Paraliobacillus sp. JSM ZJ581 TaxID=3342118 RepID=UPI0035A887A2
MAQTQEKTKRKKAGFFQWVLVIIVPLIFLIIVLSIVLSLMGIDVINKSKEIANQVPIISTVVTTQEEEDKAREQDNFKNQLAEKDSKIETLEVEVSSQSQTIDELNQEVVKLTEQLAQATENKEVDQKEIKNLTKLTKSYEEMKPDRAASILASVDLETTTAILNEMKDEDRGEVLSQMDAEIAAKLTKSLLE